MDCAVVRSVPHAHGVVAKHKPRAVRRREVEHVVDRCPAGVAASAHPLRIMVAYDKVFPQAPKTTPIHELERYLRCKDCSRPPTEAAPAVVIHTPSSCEALF